MNLQMLTYDSETSKTLNPTDIPDSIYFVSLLYRFQIFRMIREQKFSKTEISVTIIPQSTWYKLYKIIQAFS